MTVEPSGSMPQSPEERLDLLTHVQSDAFERLGIRLQAHNLSKQLRRLVSSPDATVRADRLSQLLVTLMTIVNVVSSFRDDAIRDMRAEGASYDEVARTLKVSKSRAQQLCLRLAHAVEEHQQRKES